MRPVVADIAPAPTPAARELVAHLRDQDWDGVARVIEAHWMELWFAVDPTDLRRLIGAAPPETLARFPNLGFLASMTGHTPPPALDVPAEPPTDVASLLQVAADLRLRGRPVAAMALASRLSDLSGHVRGRLVDTSGGLVGLVFVQGGTTALLAGDVTTARSMLHTAASTHRPDRFPFVPRDAAAKLALSHAVAGDVRQAAVWVERAREMPRTESWVESLVDDTLRIAEHTVAVDTLDLAQAERLRRDAPSPTAHLELWAPALLAQVRHLVLTGRRTQALALCDEVAAAGLPPDGADGWVATALDEARAIAADGVVDPSAPVRAPGATGALARCLPWFRTGQFARVADEAATDVDGPDRRPVLALELLRGQSLLRLERADEGRAVLDRALEEVLDLSALSVLRFLTAQDLAAITDREPGSTAAAVVAEHDLNRVEVVAVLRAQLTRAETQVLRALRQGRTRKEIADELYLSMSTVKSHLNSAYRKLGVTDRAGALAALERLDL